MLFFSPKKRYAMLQSLAKDIIAQTCALDHDQWLEYFTEKYPPMSCTQSCHVLVERTHRAHLVSMLL